MHGLVDAVPADGEPVVDAAQRRQDLAFDAGFLGDFADRRFLVVLLALRVSLRQAPFQAAAAVKAGDNRHAEFGVGRVHHHAAGGDFLHGGEGGGPECWAGATLAPIAEGNGAFVLLPGALGTGWAMKSTLTTLART